MKMSKVIIPLVAATAVLGYVKRGKLPVKLFRAVSDIAQVSTDTTINATEKTFGGLKQSAIDELVSNTYRGFKAVINGDILEYWYKSASGKSNYMSSLTLDSVGKINIQMVKGHPEATGSPLAFGRKLIEEMKNKENS
jgi:hypothetical protein